MIIGLALCFTGCAELVLVGQTIVVAGKVAEHLLEHHKPTPTPTK